MFKRVNINDVIIAECLAGKIIKSNIEYTDDDLLEYISSSLFESTDSNIVHYCYLFVKIPLLEISEHVKRYDTSRIDELKFIESLCEEYSLGRNLIIERIQLYRKFSYVQK